MSKKTEYKLKNEQYMLDLQNKEGIHKLPKRILYEVLAAGSGRQHPGPRSIMTCNSKAISSTDICIRIFVFSLS